MGRRSAINVPAIICGGLLLVAGTRARVSAEEFSPAASKSQLAGMGLGGMKPLSGAAGRQVRGNRAIFGSFDAIGIPLAVGSGTRLVAILNWSYHPGFPHVPTMIWWHLRDTQTHPELLPPAPREF